MRVNQEQASSSGADKQRDEDASQPPPLHSRRAPVGDVAHKECHGCGCSGRKHTLDMKRSNRGALIPIASPHKPRRTWATSIEG